MNHSKEERIIALAGLFQAAGLVAEIAQGKTPNQAALKSSIESLFITHPDNTLAVFGGDAAHIRYGLEQLRILVDNQKHPQHAETARYVINLLAVEKELKRQAPMLDTIGSRLKHLSYKREHFSDNFPELLAGVSGLYQDTISTLPHRIKVTGDRNHLTQTAVSDKIRALLFTGVRAAMLWRQVGGSKWQLLLGRGEIDRISQQLLNTIQTNH